MRLTQQYLVANVIVVGLTNVAVVNRRLVVHFPDVSASESPSSLF